MMFCSAFSDDVDSDVEDCGSIDEFEEDIFESFSLEGMKLSQVENKGGSAYM